MVLMELQTDPYPQETSWDLITADGDTLVAMNGYEAQNTLYLDSICVPDDIDITFNLYDTYGDGLTSGAGNGEFHLYVCGAQVFSGSSFEYLFSGGNECLIFNDWLCYYNFNSSWNHHFTNCSIACKKV